MSATASEYLHEALQDFRKYRDLGARAIEQLDDADLHRMIDSEANSVALLVKHLRGNMISRWTDFLTTDGEKPDRGRDGEFEMEAEATREEVERWYDEGWQAALRAIEALRPTDLARVVTIRGEPVSVIQAIQRNLLHAAYHVGQIVLLAKHFRGSEWMSLSIPRRR